MASKRRGQNEGSIYQRQDGRWVGVVHLGYADGKRLRKQFYGQTRRDVAQRLATALKEHQDGLPLVSEKQTVKDFLKSWLEATKPSLRPTTYATYEIVLRLHVTPHIGSIRLARLMPQHLQKLYSERLE